MFYSYQLWIDPEGDDCHLCSLPMWILVLNGGVNVVESFLLLPRLLFFVVCFPLWSHHGLIFTKRCRSWTLAFSSLTSSLSSNLSVNDVINLCASPPCGVLSCSCKANNFTALEISVDSSGSPTTAQEMRVTYKGHLKARLIIKGEKRSESWISFKFKF